MTDVTENYLSSWPRAESLRGRICTWRLLNSVLTVREEGSWIRWFYLRSRPVWCSQWTARSVHRQEPGRGTWALRVV